MASPSAHFPRRRKAPPPIPRKLSLEQAKMLRQWYALGVHYRMLGKMFGVAPGSANDCVRYRGAYLRDKEVSA